MKCERCGAATALRRKGHSAGWHLLEWCLSCGKPGSRGGAWVPHARMAEWGFRWLDEVPLVPFENLSQGVLL